MSSELRDSSTTSPPADAATPYLWLDEARLEHNLVAMQQRANAAGVQLRPHAKTHKSVRLAKKQIQLGAVGITVAKPSEALVFVEGGIGSITLAYPVIDASAIDGLLEAVVGAGADLRFLAADPAGLAALAMAASRHKMRLPVFIKVDVGLGRVGVKPETDAALDLARAICERQELSFAGLLSHAGQAYGAADPAAIQAIARKEQADMLGLKARLLAQGIAVPCVSVGSTPTCLGASIAEGVDEIRPGNYAFLDRTALQLGLCTPDEPALCVVASVVARNERYAIVDAGSKALSSDRGPHGTSISGFGQVVELQAAAGRDWVVEKMSEEHGFVPCKAGELPIGTRVRILPNHACATAACFDTYGPALADPPDPVDARGRFI